MEQNIAKGLLYGIQDFVTIAEQNYYYVDKTMYIPALEEQARNLFCIRSHRFLLYYGLLTIKGEHGCRLTLGIPNESVRKLYCEHFML